MKKFFLLIPLIFLTPSILSAQTLVAIVYESSGSSKYSDVYVKNKSGTKVSVTIVYRNYSCLIGDLGKYRENEITTLYPGSKRYLGHSKTYCATTNRYHEHEYRLKSWYKKE